MALSAKEVQQAKGFAIFLAVAAVGVYWYFLWNPKRIDPVEGLVMIQQQIDSLQAAVDSARADLAAGTIESLEERIAGYESSLGVMRELVPSGNDLPNLIDTITSRATLRDVTVAQWTPLAVEPGVQFDIYRYRFSVFGHFDQVGEFLADVASLPRIMVPYEVALEPAGELAQQAYADTTGALLEATFILRTFVKRTGGDQ